MITIYNALSWLNSFEDNRTSLQRDILAAVRRMSTAPTEDELNQWEDDALDICRSRDVFDPYEYAEIKLNCAAAKFARKSFSEAELCVNEAIKLYPTNHHRLGVALWVLGIIETQLSRYRDAYIDWHKAHELFSEQINDLSWRSQPIPPNIKSWYLKLIREMEFDLYGTMEFIYGLLNEAELVPDNLSEPVRSIMRSIQTEIQEDDFQTAYELIQSLLQCSAGAPNSRTLAEAMVYSGLAAGEMRNWDKAIEYLQKSSTLCLSFPHQRGVALWMLGLAQWQFQHRYNQAIITWQNGLEIFEDLEFHAATNQERRRYKRHVIRMRAVLNERTSWLNRDGPPDIFTQPDDVLIPTIQ
jgi:tetratricopeptide (TPR) repeat protein